MASSSTCDVTGTLCGVDGSPLAGAQVRAEVKSEQLDQGGQLANGVGVGSTKVSAIAGDDGTFCITVLQGATVELEIPGINLRKLVKVPAEATVDFATLV